MEKRGNFFVLLVVIAVLTLIIAVLSAFIMIVGVNPPVGAVHAETQPTVDESGRAALAPMDPRLLSTIRLFPERQLFNVSCDKDRLAVVIADVSITYINRVDGIRDVNAMITLFEDNLREIVGKYFGKMECGVISDVETRLQAKDDLKDEMNNFLISTIENERDRRRVEEIVHEVVFPTWNFQHQ